VLFVDDQEDMRNTFVPLLQKKGFQVSSAALPSEAIRLAKLNPNIELLITDFSMPEMNGFELARVITSINPSIKTLLISGFQNSDTECAKDELHFLPKPFSFQELEEKLAELFSKDK
jgi:DNA-binding NtrC family response regulator